MMTATLDFIKKDYVAHPWRHVAEVLGMVISLGVAVVIAWTTPFPPLLVCYALWETASFLLVLASYSRGSVGLCALYSGFLVIDAIGLVRTLLA